MSADPEHYEIYRVNGGKAQKAIDHFIKASKKFQREANKLLKELGAETLWENQTYHSRTIYGAEFKESPPEGWRQYVKDNTGVYRPDKTKKGKAVKERIKKVNELSPNAITDFGKLIGVNDISICSDCRIRSAGFEKVGDKWVIHVPKQYIKDHKYKAVSGMKSIKMSEYWKLKEAA